MVHTIKCVTEFLACKYESGALARTVLFLSHRGLKTPSRTTTLKTNYPSICSSCTKSSCCIFIHLHTSFRRNKWSRFSQPETRHGMEVSVQLHALVVLPRRKYSRVEY